MNKTAETSRVVDDDDDSARTPARSASRWSTLSLRFKISRWTYAASASAVGHSKAAARGSVRAKSFCIAARSSAAESESIPISEGSSVPETFSEPTIRAHSDLTLFWMDSSDKVRPVGFFGALESPLVDAVVFHDPTARSNGLLKTAPKIREVFKRKFPSHVAP